MDMDIEISSEAARKFVEEGIREYLHLEPTQTVEVTLGGYPLAKTKVVIRDKSIEEAVDGAR